MTITVIGISRDMSTPARIKVLRRIVVCGFAFGEHDQCVKTSVIDRQSARCIIGDYRVQPHSTSIGGHRSGRLPGPAAANPPFKKLTLFGSNTNR